MFHRLHEPAARVTIFLDERPMQAVAGDSVAAALLGAGVTTFCSAPRHDSARAPYCLIGICYGCLVEIDGQPYRQACLTQIVDGMRIRRMADHGL